MINYQNDPHFLRLVAHSDDLRRRSVEANQRFERVSAKATSLLETETQRKRQVNALLIQTAPPRRA